MGEQKHYLFLTRGDEDLIRVWLFLRQWSHVLTLLQKGSFTIALAEISLIPPWGNQLYARPRPYLPLYLSLLFFMKGSIPELRDKEIHAEVMVNSVKAMINKARRRDSNTLFFTIDDMARSYDCFSG